MRVSILLVGMLLTVALLAALPPGFSWEADEDADPLVRASPAYDKNGDRIFDELERTLATTSPDQAVDVIVVFTGATLEEGLEAIQKEIGEVQPRFEFPRLPGVALSLDRDEIHRVAELDVTRQIEEDVEGTPELSSSTHYIGSRAVWNDLGFTGDRDGDEGSFTKDDVTIAVLDTGIHAGHVDFEGKIIGWHDTVSGQSEPYDPNGHGTHVASIAAGLGNGNEEHTGVAPGASLVGVRISNKAHAAAAVEWVMDNQETYGIDIMTMSFGFGIGADGTDSLAILFDRAFTEAGILAVKSTGNSGPNHGTMTIPGDAHHILAVGSLEDPGKTGWKVATYSSRGPTTDDRIKPELTAPGHQITAASRSTSGYTTLSGTSMAAPHIAGIAALVMSADPDLTNQEVRDLLLETAEPRGMGDGPNNDYGWGVVDPYAAVKAALGEEGSNPVTTPSVETRWSTTTSGTQGWVWHVNETDYTLSLTILLDAPAGQRGFSLDVIGPQANLHSRAHPDHGARHVNFNIPTAGPGDYLFLLQANHAGHEYSIDASANWPDQATLLHGFELPTLPL